MNGLLDRFRSLRGCWAKMVVDGIGFAVALTTALWVREGGLERPTRMVLLTLIVMVVPVKVAVFHYFGAYRSAWRYSSMEDARELIRAAVLSMAFVFAAGFLVPREIVVPRSLPFLDLLFSITFIGGLRMLSRTLHDVGPASSDRGRALAKIAFAPGRAERELEGARRILVVGAGDAGEMIVREMMRSTRARYRPVAFIDDDPAKLNQRIRGVQVLGSRQAIPRLVRDFDIQDILIAIPSMRGRELQSLVSICRGTSAKLKLLPDVSQIVEGRVNLADVRNVQVEDLLGREPAELDLSLISSYLRGRRVLVTGAGGSIGAELCRQILQFGPQRIVLLGRGEHSIHEIFNELRPRAGSTELHQVIGDVINRKKLEGVFARFRPEIVFHAGADKHVPLMEMNPDEAVFNNIIGTKNVLDVSAELGVGRVVCISTDKAVNPSSVMGCCKRVAELLVRSVDYPDMVAVAVRFGNVLGSRGSVIPHFRKQIEAGGPLTITSREMRRYFMTIPEASGLVIQAGAMGEAGELFVLDMGEPVRIWDLAENMVRLAGLEPGIDIEMREIGLRPGEKLNEQLQTTSETRRPTVHSKIFCVVGGQVDAELLAGQIEQLRDRAMRMDFAGIRSLLHQVVPEFRQPEEDGRSGFRVFPGGRGSAGGT
jgi:FlaA1/EpsC-like NDP-sugar epimerase